MADISIMPHDSYADSEEGVGPGESGDCDSSVFHQDEDSLTSCARLDKYALSENVLYRQMVPSILLEIFRDAPAESLTMDIPALMDTVSMVAQDNEITVRTDFVQRVPHLAAACAEYSTRVPALANITVDHLLPLVVRYLGDADNQVRKATHTTLLTLMEQGLVPREAIEAQVCPKVIQFSHAKSLVDYHTGAVTLMSKMVPLLGRETTERLFLQRFSELCSNELFYIRKICASSFGEFCAVVGRTAYENVLLPCYIELCADDVWGVRKACAEVVMTVSCACSPYSRRNLLAIAFARLLQDQSRWVRMSAFQTLGPFISTFADPSIIGLTYNQHGELVLINPEGTEFRINSPAFTDANLKAAADFKQMYYQAQERIINKNTMFDNSDYDYKTHDPFNNMQMMHDLGFQDSNIKTESMNTRSDEKENNLSKNIPYSADSKSNSCNTIKIVVEGLEIEVDTFIDTKTESNSTAEVDEVEQCNEDSESACKESDESSEDNKDNLNSDLFNNYVRNNITSIVNEVSDTFKELIIESSETKDKDTVGADSDSTNATDVEEDLNKYNPYQYWYISPEMPLDPDIVDAGKTSDENTTDQYGDSFIDRLDNLMMNDSWNQLDTTSKEMDETVVLASTVVQYEQPGLSQQIVPQLLIDHFVSMTNSELATNTDNDMAYHCAFSLPAVALTLGRSNWHMLKKTCEVLASDMQYKVRRTVASSLHELALILGQELAADHLAPIFDGFIKDLDEVRIGVLKHLAHFLKLIGPEKRNLYLPRLAEFLQTDNEWNWRFREELANQLLIAVPLFQAVDASKHIVMLAQELLCDKVSAVRQVALALVTELVRHVSGDPSLTSWLLMKLAEEFAHSKRWVRRQAFALLCSCLISSSALPPEKFATEVMPHLLDLSWDPVPNVRLAVSRTIARDIIVHDYVLDEQHEALYMALRRLQADKDSDVRQYAVTISN